MTGQSKGFNLKNPYQADWYIGKKSKQFTYKQITTLIF